jgi:hypothetical protein
MTKTLNPPTKSEYFFQQHWESEYFFRKPSGLKQFGHLKKFLFLVTAAILDA